MTYKCVFQGWNDLSLDDLIVAYRKAKADCFYENTFPTAIKFADYEQNLLANLSGLLRRLKSENGFLNDKSLIGEFRLVPKKLGVKKMPGVRNGHIHFSDPDRAFEYLLKTNKITPEFRIIGDFPVDTHVISALWLNSIGHKFDACLNDVCYGARLKRVGDDELFRSSKPKPFHITAIGSFPSYFFPYQKWRNDGLQAIRNELEHDHDIIAASIDLKSYYHLIDPIALASEGLQSTLGLIDEKALSEEEKRFTQQLAVFLSSWSKGATLFAEQISTGASSMPGGLAIGLTSTRVISNVLLYRWDQLIREKVTPVHYGRYVDDMFLVMRDPGNIHNTDDFMIFLKERLGENHLYRENSEVEDSPWCIDQGERFQGKTLIRLQPGKQKLFILQGQAGKDLLDSIEKEIYELSSEYRLMPAPDHLEDSTAARVLSAAGDASEQADTLSRADGLTIRRLSWALQLRHVETLARDLPACEWKKQRDDFYEFAQNHILRPDTLFAHYTHLPRLLGFAIGLNEWSKAEQIVQRAFTSLDRLAEQFNEGALIVINGSTRKATKALWRSVKGSLTWSFIDAAAKYYDPDELLSIDLNRKQSRLAGLFVKQIIDELISLDDFLNFKFGSEDFHAKAPLIALADLAKCPYKKLLSSKSAPALLRHIEKRKQKNLLEAFSGTQLLNTPDLIKFLRSTRKKRLCSLSRSLGKGENLLPFMFPTRPYTPAEIAELAPECVGLVDKQSDKPSATWAKYARAIRGVWVKPTLLATEQDKVKQHVSNNNRRLINIGTKHKKTIVVALTNLKTDDTDWAAMACNMSNLTMERYKRISELVNHAIQLKPKPDYVLFPELSIPLAWLDSISARLLASGISLIAGTEYRHYTNDEIVSEACLALTDDRLGFPASVKIWQPKTQPAAGEDRELTSKFGKTWYYSDLPGKRQPAPKPVFKHNGFHFGVMVCSELQNSKARISFQGEVDALMVLAWNQDLDTFSALIEAAALDIHAYNILVNNRKFGDSRVRSPAKQDFLRDLARVRGGDNDFCVAVTLDLESLRAFQSRAKRWPEETDLFKPIPEGFKISKSRKHLPPS